MSTISAGTTSTTTLIATGDTTGSLVFKTNDTGSGGTTAMTIDTSQNVGIGTSSPTNALQLVGTAKASSQLYVGSNSDDNYSGGIQNLSNSSRSISIQADPTNSGASTILTFGVDGTERARIDSSGRMGLGTSSPDSNYYLTVGVTSSDTYAAARFNRGTTSSTTSIAFANPNGVVGSISTSGTSTAYNTSSDYRLKHDIAPMTGALAKVSALKPVTYKWNADNSAGEGFIAHELVEVVPQCVTGEKDAIETYTDEEGNEQTRPVYQGIDTSFLVATLTAAIQELKALNDAQASTITQLTERISALENK